MSPRTFGEHLRKARMDAGLMIKQQACMLGVTPDKVINWELGDEVSSEIYRY